MQKKVSVIITTYKREVNIVERAIKSVANQNYKNVELIVVNDNPEDKKLSRKIERILKNYKEIMPKYIVLDKNSGACKARNIGIENSTGFYIAFLDDDDEWLKNKIEEQVKVLENDSELGIAYCNTIVHDDDKNKDIVRFTEIQPSGYIYNQILVDNIIGSCSFPMFPKKVLLEFNGFREDMPAMQDWELYLRISKKYSCYYIDTPLAIYHKYQGDRISKNYQKRVVAHQKIEEEFYDDIKSNRDVLYAFNIADCNIYSANSQRFIAFKHWIKAVSLKPFKIKNNLKAIVKLIVTFFVKGNRL